MDLLTRAGLTSLAQPSPAVTHVSLFIPTHRFGGAVEADKLRWKNLVVEVETTLSQQMRTPDVKALLAPARALQADGMAWQHMGDGLAMFLRKDWHRTFQISARMPTLAAIGDRPLIGPMLQVLGGDDHFLLLALSQREIRLMEGNRDTVEQVELSDISTSLRDVVEPQEPRSDTMARPAALAGRGGPAVFYGHGAGDRHLKDTEVTSFLRTVSSGLHDILVTQTSPMVLVGLTQLVAAYREVSSYGNLMDDAVEHNPDQCSADELHQMAWPMVEQRLQTEQARAASRFRDLHGTGRVSGDLETVAEAARQGRVETLFVEADPECWEHAADGAPTVVQLDSGESYAEREQVDGAATATLNHNGRIYTTSQPVAPGSQVAAIFRY